MKTKILFLTIFSFVLLILACKKDNINIIDGTYKGTFTLTSGSGVQTGQTTLELKNGKFVCSGNSNRIPAGGSGTFSSDNSQITFQDENTWTAEFDWNLILNGKYDYSFDGKKLILSANKTNSGNYKYILEKQ